MYSPMYSALYHAVRSAMYTTTYSGRGGFDIASLFAGDQYLANVASLLHFDGADGSTTFVDETGRTWSRTGTAEIDTAWAAFGQSLLLPASRTSRISTPDAPELRVGARDFTIELFCRPQDVFADYYIIAAKDNLSTEREWVLLIDKDAGGRFVFGLFTDSGTFSVQSTTVPVIGGEYYLRVVRVGSSLSLHVNNTVEGTVQVGSAVVNATARPLTVGGADTASTLGWYGNVDEFRFTVGAGRTLPGIPTEPFRNGVQGWWFDNSDLSTLFQDSAGTTPVTAAGQPVGLQLDKSKGLVRGAELLGTGVPAMAGVSDIAEYNASTGAGTAYRSDQYNQSFVNIPGLSMANWYFVDVTNTGVNTLSVRADLASGAAFFSIPPGQRKAGFARNVTTVVITSDADVSGVAFTVNSVRSVAGNHRYQTSAASRPILRQNATTGAYYLETDGSDDWMVTNAIDFTGTDKVTLMAGVRKLSDAAGGVLIELSAGYSTHSGTFGVFAPGAAGPRFDFVSRGAGGTSTGSVASGFAAPISAVLTGVGAVSTDTMLLRVNGAQAGQNTADQGTGPYGSHPAYFFRRAGTSVPFNGHEYGAICVGRLCTAAEITAIERLLAQRVGVTLV